ncbi:hypothetical protein BSL82_02275 [Tardibacter chloracetimidivorans]|uniref:Tip attachment protein J domain-containing protein n=1 Tax=Tardibacter chloracetimidivorans TaxID=1921510 RepID=A0A1L3ZRL3_9SPHN|nr:hypothetical protein [Tardibacter chloracetimidivorans]API58274.1 hypothetical protein BSL82_02275 [Tardibacter chloracetimidivorans]
MTLAVLVELEPFDPSAASSVTLRACSHDNAALTALNAVTWWPGIARLPRLSLRLFDGGFSGRMTPGGGDMELSLDVFPDAASYTWGDRPARIWIGELGAAWGGFTQIFDGLVRTARVEGGRIALQLRVNDDWLDGPLLTESYEGTTGAEGPAEKKGVAKPLAIGAPRYVEGQLIDSVNTVVQLHGYGAINAVPVAMDRLVRFGAPIADHASYAALVAATIAPGQYATAKAVGMVRHGAPPEGVLSYMVEGDSGGSGGFVRTPGAVIKRLAEIAGASAGQIDSASLTALDTAVPRNLSRYFGEQTTPRDAIGEIAGSANAVAGVSLMGKLFACRVMLSNSASLTLKTDGSALPIAGEPAQLEVAPPFWRMQMKGTRTARIHAYSEIAVTATLQDLGDYDATRIYREGSIVRQPSDGRRYRYINPVASAGNAPPNSTYWTVHEEAPGSLITVDTPPDIEEFGVNVLGNTAHFSLKPVSGNGLSHYLVKYQPVVTGAEWPNAVTLLPRLSIDTVGFSLPAMNGSFLIKAVNRDGGEAVNATIVSVNVLTLNALNLVATVGEDPAFAGVWDDVIEGELGLILSGGQSWDNWSDFDAVEDVDFGDGSPFVEEGYYYFDNDLDLGAVYTSRLTALIEATGVDTRTSFDLVPDVDALESWDGADPTAWNVELQVRTSDDGLAFGDWRTFTIGDYTARAFQWRVRLRSSDPYVTPVLVAVSVTVDMPDRTLGGNDIVCPAGGMTVSFATPFRAVPAVAITGQNLATGDYASVTSKTASGFFIRFFNAAGSGVSRTFDWLAKGYGVEA